MIQNIEYVVNLRKITDGEQDSAQIFRREAICGYLY